MSNLIGCDAIFVGGGGGGTPGADATVKNSDMSYTNTVAGGGTLVLPDITVTDSDGSTSSFPSVKNVTCSPAADATVENSDSSYTNTVASGGTLTLPDITVTDSDGSTFTQPSVVNVVCSLAADGTVENSDSSYTNTVASGGTLVLPDITVTDSDGSTSSFPSVKNVVCTPAADATVENSDSSYTNTVASGGTLVLPDITVTDVDGSTRIVPSVQNVVCVVSPLPLITLYQRPTTPFSNTSYGTGDTASQVASGIFDNWNDTTALNVSKQVQTLDYSAVNPFINLLFNNPFGNKDRFTDENGLQVYGNDVWVDNLTGLRFSTIPIATNESWADALITTDAFTDPLGNSDYYIMPCSVYLSLCNFSPSSLIQDWISLVPTFNNVRYYWLADTRADNATQKYSFRGATQGATLTFYSSTTTQVIPYSIIDQPTTPNP